MVAPSQDPNPRFSPSGLKRRPCRPRRPPRLASSSQSPWIRPCFFVMAPSIGQFGLTSVYPRYYAVAQGTTDPLSTNTNILNQVQYVSY